MKYKQEQKSGILAPPRKPNENECCGRGCSPCIFDYYRDALQKWQEQYSIVKDDKSIQELR